MLEPGNKIFNLLGLARKAGKLQAGTEAVKGSLKKGDCCLLVISTDMSDRIKKDYMAISSRNDIKCLEIADRIQLGRAVGKSQVTILSVNEAGIAQQIIKLYEVM